MRRSIYNDYRPLRIALLLLLVVLGLVAYFTCGKASSEHEHTGGKEYTDEGYQGRVFGVKAVQNVKDDHVGKTHLDAGHRHEEGRKQKFHVSQQQRHRRGNAHEGDSANA